MKAKEIQKELRRVRDKKRAEHSKGFFKTGEGEYGEGDEFLGIRVPVIRGFVRKFKDAPVGEILKVLKSRYHEERLFAVLSLVAKFKRAKDEERAEIYKLYLDNTKYINNWDLVDSSAAQIVGAFLENSHREKLYELAASNDLWERRIAIISTHHMIKKGDFGDALKISQILLNDTEDLIHKAVGWMLREVGNRDPAAERRFLKNRYKKMPRTMLRYAIEKFEPEERQLYLKGLL